MASDQNQEQLQKKFLSAHFSRHVWNFHDRSHKFRTNYTSETYNRKMNGHLDKAKLNIY
jgi:hypothetical protein